MSEELTRFQIQLLLYFLEAEPKKRTVTDAARYFGKTKVSVTRTLDSLEKLGIVERTQARKTVLSHYGTKLAQKFQQQYQIAERYMQYLDLTPLQAKNNALSALLAGFSEEYLNRMQEQEERMYIKEVFAGRQNFSGQELCDYLKDGSYFFPFVIYREHIKNGNNISMGNRGFEHPCELIVKDHIGTIYLTIKTVSAPSALTGQLMDGRIKSLSYQLNGKLVNAEQEGRYYCFPAKALQFISMGSGRDIVLHGSVCMQMQCSVGIIHMPESLAIFTMFIS